MRKSFFLSLIVLFFLLQASAGQAANFARSAIIIPPNSHYFVGQTGEFIVDVINIGTLPKGAVFAQLTFDKALIHDVTSLEALVFSKWEPIPLSITGTDVVAQLNFNTGYGSVNERILPLRVNFSKSGSYLLGFDLIESQNRVLTSSTIPVKVGKAQILGALVYRFQHNLRYGHVNNEVVELQKRLTQDGFFKGPQTGFFGTMTRNAVKAYQGAHGLSQTGVLGPEILDMLNR
ncbi:MAG: hypothetical protein A2660_00420 [Candidatus Doudnabacteria bacterium RIFCSPHIGHO2_01_FULL_45_18]|uniref:Peptidoglycan binding-like domain-containing protein n=1 Tax=Candidatus Doudnabacteria bacterium RIFCSPHIGHO2_01_FULL_45_18 TaxID=1817823 RepID=A0A1F5NQE1_9BACT|nr:MAG: hypothetical protein A2660_00420 [Candidatus Doudnabacteria bacterium RIFCSPHIGHO2_01_FULL_45_18]